MKNALKYTPGVEKNAVSHLSAFLPLSRAVAAEITDVLIISNSAGAATPKMKQAILSPLPHPYMIPTGIITVAAAKSIICHLRKRDMSVLNNITATRGKSPVTVLKTPIAIYRSDTWLLTACSNEYAAGIIENKKHIIGNISDRTRFFLPIIS
ncbi:MAG: hypothetical protein J6O50_17420 [Ruminiclostridium sp.]|nr:hypothetical protein [Ruminiclostridium sp.]